MAPRRRIRRQASSPDANVGKPKARRSWAVGRGWTRRRGLGDDAERAFAAHEELGQVRARGGTGAPALGADDTPVGQHDLQPDHHVLDLPVARRVLPRATTSQPAPDGGEVHGLGPVAERVARVRSRRPQRRLQVGPERARADVCEERGLVERDAVRPIRSGRARRRRAPGWSRRTPRCVPRPPSPARPRSLHAASTAETWATETGRTTAAGRCGTAPSAAQPMASGHQSRPLRPGRRVRGHGGAARSDPIEHGVGHLDDVRPRRSRTSPGSASMGVTGVGAVTPARVPPSGAPSDRRPRSGRPGRRPRCSSHPISGASNRATSGAAAMVGVRPQDPRARPPRQHVVEGERHLLACGVDQLGSRVGQPGNGRFQQIRPAVGEGQHGRGLGAVASDEAAGALGQRDTGSRGLGRRADEGQRLGDARTPSRRLAEDPDGRVDGVLRHLAVRGELAPGDRDQTVGRGLTPCAGATGPPSAPTRGRPWSTAPATAAIRPRHR